MSKPVKGGFIIRNKSIFKTLYIYLVLICLYLPIAVVVFYSFNVSKSSAVFTGFTLDWYADMINDRHLIEAFGISLIVALSSAAISVVVGTLGAVSLNKLNKRIRAIINTVTYIPIIIPEIILAVSLLMFFSFFNAAYGISTLILSHATFCIPYVFIMVALRLLTIDPGVYEAAVDLGARPLQIFLTITLPLILPAVVSGAMLAVAMSLDDVIISVFLSGPKSTTLPVKIYSMLKLGVTPKINALFTVILAVTFLVIGLMNLFERLNNNERGES